jgi:hypothetical protein
VGLVSFKEDSSTNVFKLKLNISEVQEYSLFEGEVVACYGCFDAKDN